MNKTFLSSHNFFFKKWYLINAENQILGRFASQIIKILVGKHKLTYSPFLPSNTRLIIINAKKICISGNKLYKKKYFHYSGYPSGLHFKTFFELQSFQSEKLIRTTILGMLPKTLLGRKMIKQLYIYSGNKHYHSAQFPKALIL
uniref:Ribosomal protein L13 n=1 Tax=Pteridomonas sp. YPF1301 TaxID=2766739 RepID=A0A7G1MRM7_9STRA|nr:ribosomal protein L13 [Pteridomonas sp. YPF1301]